MIDTAGLISEMNNESEIDLQEGDLLDFTHYHGTVLKMYRNSVESIQLTVKEEFIEGEVIELSTEV